MIGPFTVLFAMSICQVLLCDAFDVLWSLTFCVYCAPHQLWLSRTNGHRWHVINSILIPLLWDSKAVWNVNLLLREVVLLGLEGRKYIGCCELTYFQIDTGQTQSRVLSFPLVQVKALHSDM